MKRLLLVLLLLGLCGPVFAQGPYEWNLSFRGNPEAFQGGFFWSPPDVNRVQVGPEFSYWDRLRGENDDATAERGYSLEIVARYFGLKDVPLELWKFTVNTNWYLGMGLGPSRMQGQSIRNVADVRTGFIFGEGPIWFGIGYQGVISNLLWDGLSDVDNRVFGEILIGVGPHKTAAGGDLSGP